MKLIDVSTPKHPNTFAMVDDEDFDRINAHGWCAFQRRGEEVIYATRGESINGRRPKIKMHREILGESAPPIIDHKDRNGLNNQKENLRSATAAQNSFNSGHGKKLGKTSKYRGVSRVNRPGPEKWRAQIGGKRAYIGQFPTEELAYAAYLEAAGRIYGEFVPAELLSTAKGGAL